MSEQFNPTTHIDIRVVKNLLITRINEGKELAKSANVSNDWRKKEYAAQDRYNKCIKLIDEAISIKEDMANEVSNDSNQSSKASTEGNKDNRQTGV